MSLYSPASKFKVSPSDMLLITDWISELEDPAAMVCSDDNLLSSVCSIIAISSVCSNCMSFAVSSANTQLELNNITDIKNIAKINLSHFILSLFL